MNTFLVDNNKTINLNESVSFQLSDISYSYDDDEESEQESEKEDKAYHTRTRKNKNEADKKEKARQPHQISLRKKKIQEITERFNKNTLIKEKKVEQIDIKTLVS